MNQGSVHAKIRDLLTLFTEVNWDRWSGQLDDFSIFGWINRPQDAYKDFVELTIVKGELETISTSSAKYSAEFCRRFDFEHNDCKRVESAPFAPENCIRLAERRKKAAVNPATELTQIVNESKAYGGAIDELLLLEKLSMFLVEHDQALVLAARASATQPVAPATE